MARVLLRFASSAFALLMRRVLVRGELSRSASRPLPGVLLGFDRGALAGLMAIPARTASASVRVTGAAPPGGR